MARNALLTLALACSLPLAALAQSSGGRLAPLPAQAPTTAEVSAAPAASPVEVGPPPEPCDRAYPISLQSALELSGARVLDVQLAGARVNEALAELQRARVLWLPTVYLGIDYFRHDGQIQDVAGRVISTSKSAVMVGGAPYAVFATGDALFGPMAARQVLAARQAQFQASENDSLLAVAVAFFDVQQARG